MKRDPILALIAADPNVDAALADYCADYTEQELAGLAEEQAQEEAAQEALDRAERAALREAGIRT